MGENEKAFHDYRQVLKFNTESFAAWVGLGDYYTHNNRYQEALTHYTKALNFTSQASNELSKISPKCFQEESGQNKNELHTSVVPKEDNLFEMLKNRQNNYHEKPLQYSRRYRLNTEVKGSDTKFTYSKEREISETKPKIGRKGATSPFHHHPFQNKQETKYSYGKTMGEEEHKELVCHPPAVCENQRYCIEIKLKIAICLYFLGDYEKSIKTLKGLATKSGQFNSEIYYYLAVSQQKLHEQERSKKTKMIEKVRNLKKEDRSRDVELSNNCSSLVDESIINFELSIKSASNTKVMVKSCKSLIKFHIENNQFYETEAIIKLAQGYGLDIKEYKELSEACMLVIKQKYSEAIPILNKLYQQITGINTSRMATPEQKEYKEKNYHKPCNDEKTSLNCLRLSENKLSNEDLSLRSSNKQKRKLSPKENDKKDFKIAQSPSFIPLEQSKLLKKESENLDTGQNQINKGEKYGETGKIGCAMNMKEKKAKMNDSSKSCELEWMRPIILLFKAYSEYFENNFLQCLTLYEIYENYLTNYLGKEPESSIELSYNKVLCEGVLMLNNEMIQESLDRFVDSLDGYHRKFNAIPVEPILLRILAMFRMAISESPYFNEKLSSKERIIVSIIEILEHYLPAIKDHPLVHYYYGIVLYELGNYKKASDCLEKYLKITDECTWKFLFVKGLIEMKNFALEKAAREFSAGLLVEERAEIFLGRCICYILLSEEQRGENEIYMERSYEDLQRFIELEEDKAKVSKWATKILFMNKQFEEAMKWMQNIPSQTIENDGNFKKIEECFNIFTGEFEEGGVLGKVIINAFEGNFEYNLLHVNLSKHHITLSDFVDSKYNKWLNILNLYSAERYLDLVKFLQVAIFEEQIEQHAVELRYNLAVVYYLLGEMSKADNLLVGLPKLLEHMNSRVEKLINRDLIEDECIDDLQVEFKGVKRLSSFLPYRRAILEKKGRFFTSDQKFIFMKISIPFPPFKLDLDLNLDFNFLNGETAQSCIPKKIEAPWIKKLIGQIQFTDNIVDSSNTSILDQDEDDLLASKSESESENINESHQF